MARRFSWLGGGQSAVAPQKAPVVAVKEKKAEVEQTSSRSRDHSRHHKHRRKEEIRKDTVYEHVCPNPTLPPVRRDSGHTKSPVVQPKSANSSATKNVQVETPTVRRKEDKDRREGSAKKQEKGKERAGSEVLPGKAGERPSAAR